MKKIVLLVTFLTSISLSTAQESVKVLLEDALNEATASNKHVLVKFEASWCGWCHRMTNQIKDPKIATYFNENYVMLPIVVFENGKQLKLENPGSRELIATYKGDKAGLPFWVILDATGAVVTDSFNAKEQNLGCPSSKEEVLVFIEKLKATSNMTEETAQNVAQVFTKK
jgi:thioredoxin-related protein